MQGFKETVIVNNEKSDLSIFYFLQHFISYSPWDNYSFTIIDNQEKLDAGYM